MAKRRKIFVYIVAALMALGVLYFQFGIFERYNFITAYIDLWNGRERIITYGERLEDDSLRAITARRLGFEYQSALGCLVTPPVVNGIDHYNNIMGKHLSKRLGGHWSQILDQAVMSTKRSRVAADSVQVTHK